MQSLLESHEVSTDSRALTARGDTVDDQKPSRTVAVQLTTDEVVGSAITLFLAGSDTTSTGLGFLLHCLGKYPDVQQRLRDEIEEALERCGEITYEVAMNLKYMDRVIQETFRHLPPVTGIITRRALTNVDICGTGYPAGLAFYFPPQRIHKDPKYWDEPSKFDPDRFLKPLKHPLAYQAFGAGPRNCVGMRPALLFLKLSLCKLIPEFEFKSDEDPKCRGVMIVTHAERIMIAVKHLK
ncbi:cytochrome P450 3A6 [Galendromus occidentalis]|uniref:Cytochrome P450 3A6 n=1 Tax=Galendromus occidentalis TaxID=34638 RepID=A0AAJ6VXY8_9ACAR|nr:cytochrome P450 3A6 [Galendromus occidentalis]